ncbi:hypothetical protein FSARC_14974 [Fusarium sarcochroum]|uniref:Berberine/berberine-like domain-containing protein n=1 Tax=Fusarium sarcochroum TaxID=1208366 RepID=A0A8H4SPC4_9HYPO|nr:hypothetical protein FSARC_14974 [Fusarium sarcochroum]
MEGGALWAHAYHELINDHHDGYVINGGRCPSVGVSGFTLGGGLGPFTRSFGMGSDTLLEATLVTADNENEILTVKASDPKDSKKGKLFWALCGAGGGNFGVLVKLKMKLQKLHSDLVVAGRYLWSPTDQKDFTDSMIRFYTAKWSNEMTIDSSWLCDLKDKREDPQVRFLVYYNGREAAFDAEIDKHLGDLGMGERKGELAKQLKRRTLEEKSTRFLHETLVSQWSEETQKALPSNAMFRIYTSFIFQNDEGQITKITSILKDKMTAFKKRFEGEEGLLQVTWIHSGGRANEKDTGDSAYPWRKCIYHTYIMIEWKEKWLELDMRDALQELNLSLRKYSTNGLGVFINFPDEALKKEAYEEAYYGENRRELQQVKATWDKGNVFEWSQGVPVGPHVGDNVAARSAAPRAARGDMYTISHHDGDECKDTVAHEEFLKPKALTDRAPREQWDSYSPILLSGLVGPAYALASLVS